MGFCWVHRPGHEPLWTTGNLSGRLDWMAMFSAEKTAPLQHSHLMALLCILPKTWSFSRVLNAALEMFLLWDCFYGKFYSDRIQTFWIFFKYEKSNNRGKFNVKWVNTSAIYFWIILRKSDKCQLLPAEMRVSEKPWSCHQARVSPSDLDDSPCSSL